jgi:hypothetical protein
MRRSSQKHENQMDQRRIEQDVALNQAMLRE